MVTALCQRLAGWAASAIDASNSIPTPAGPQRGRSSTLREVKTQLLDALSRLHSEGGSDNRLVVSRGPAWFVVRTAVGDGRARCIAATQKHLGKALSISAKGVVALRQANFAKASGERALSRRVSVATDEEREELAAQLLGWFETVFDLSADSHSETRLALKLGAAPVMNNDELHQAIRVLAKERSMDARQAVYRSLLRAQLQLMVDESGAPAPFGSLGGAATYAVFTSVAESDLWDPRGLEMELAPGWSIIPRLHALNPGSLRINPDGRLGGELYRNEVESLARACGSNRQR